MHTVQYEYRVREELNKDLIKTAAFERWSHHLGLHRTSEQHLDQRLVRHANEWLKRQERAAQCNEALPACGLTPIA